MSRRRFMGEKSWCFFQQRFFPAGTYTFTVPEGCTSVDVFLVGAGGGGNSGSGGGGGYTKTFKKDTTGYRDGGAISVTPGEKISIIVGAGGKGNSSSGNSGGYSQFKSSSYRANGGQGAPSGGYVGGNGGSGGGGDGYSTGYAGSNGNDGEGDTRYSDRRGGYGQGHTTRDFGESSGGINAGGGASDRGV